MNVVFTPLRVLILALLAVRPADAGPPDFLRDVIPVLTRGGCNAGACHGAAVGRGGFRLSLYGSRPQQDFRSIVEELESRRVNLVDPASSLVLTKPTETLSHGGGERFGIDSESARILHDWIAAGTPEPSPGGLDDLIIDQPTRVVERTGTVVPLSVEARFSKSDHRDVTRWTVFTAEDDSAVELLDDPPAVRVLRPGRHIVIARYLDRVVPLEFLVPLAAAGDGHLPDSAQPHGSSSTAAAAAGPESAQTLEHAAATIDRLIEERLQVLRLPIGSVCDDATFLRRATLDLTGRLPTAGHTRQFLAGRGDSRRMALVDELVSSDEFVEWWAFLLDRQFRNRPSGSDHQSSHAFRFWLEACVREGRPWNEMVEELLLAEGDTWEVGPASFYRLSSGPREQAEYTTEVLLGVRLRCANCHDHPLDRWTQDDYHGLSAIFARVQRGRMVRYGSSGEVIHPATGEAAIPRIPGERFVENSEDPRKDLSRWVVNSGRMYLARALVNRVWSRLLGRALVESVDDHRATNPATHPELLDWLAEDLIQHGWDWKRLIRMITRTRVYQRAGDLNGLPGISREAAERFYAVSTSRPLDPEVLVDAVGDVTGVQESWESEPETTRSILLDNPTVESRTLDILGRCDREAGCESAGSTGGSELTRNLHLMNSGFLNRRLSDPSGRLSRLLDSDSTDEELIRDFYLRALVRQPRPDELEFWRKQFAAVGDTGSRRAVAEDFVWAMLNSREFLTNH